MRPEARPCPVAIHMGFALAVTSEPEPAMTTAEQWTTDNAHAVEDLIADVFVLPARLGGLGSTSRLLWLRSSSWCSLPGAGLA